MVVLVHQGIATWEDSMQQGDLCWPYMFYLIWTFVLFYLFLDNNIVIMLFDSKVANFSLIMCCVLTAIVQQEKYLEYRSVEHIHMLLLAHSWLV